MKPLIVLFLVSTIALLILKVLNGQYNFALSARIGMSAMLIFTALGHFIYTDGMVLMIPDSIPFKKEMVYFTAFIEIIGAISLHISSFRPMTAWLLIVFFLAMLPANIKASINHLNYQTAKFDGVGPIYLWFRIPLQLVFIIWVYISSIKFK